MITSILELLEDSKIVWSDPRTAFAPPGGDAVDPETLRYHVELCVQAGFVCFGTASRNPSVQLTWAGHDELERRRLRAQMDRPGDAAAD